MLIQLITSSQTLVKILKLSRLWTTWILLRRLLDIIGNTSIQSVCQDLLLETIQFLTSDKMQMSNKLLRKLKRLRKISVTSGSCHQRMIGARLIQWITSSQALDQIPKSLTLKKVRLKPRDLSGLTDLQLKSDQLKQATKSRKMQSLTEPLQLRQLLRPLLQRQRHVLPKLMPKLQLRKPPLQMLPT